MAERMAGGIKRSQATISGERCLPLRKRRGRQRGIYVTMAIPTRIRLISV